MARARQFVHIYLTLGRRIKQPGAWNQGRPPLWARGRAGGEEEVQRRRLFAIGLLRGCRQNFWRLAGLRARGRARSPAELGGQGARPPSTAVPRSPGNERDSEEPGLASAQARGAQGGGRRRVLNRKCAACGATAPLPVAPGSPLAVPCAVGCTLTSTGFTENRPPGVWTPIHKESGLGLWVSAGFSPPSTHPPAQLCFLRICAVDPR